MRVGEWIADAFNVGESKVETTAFESSRVGVVGRADSSTGQSSTRFADRAVVPSAGSCVGQCDVLSVTGAPQVASHHARTGATPPTAIAQARISHCFTTSV